MIKRSKIQKVVELTQFKALILNKKILTKTILTKLAKIS